MRLVTFVSVLLCTFAMMSAGCTQSAGPASSEEGQPITDQTQTDQESVAGNGDVDGASKVLTPQASNQESAVIDHLVYAAPDVGAASERIANEIGIAPTPGGKHPRRGTVNTLLSLGGRQYVEIIGPDPDASGKSNAAKLFRRLNAPDIITFAVENSDLEALEAKAKNLGLKTSGIRPGSRRTAAGELLEWRTLGIATDAYEGLMPFFIDWADTPHPSETSAQGARLVRVVVTHPEPDRLQEIYRELGVQAPVRLGDQPGIVAEIESAGKSMRLTGSGSGF